MFGVVEDPESFHFIRVNEPASQWYFDVPIGVYEVVVEELAPYIPCSIVWSFLYDFFTFRGRSAEASDTFIWSSKYLLTVCCTHVGKPRNFQVVFAVEYFPDVLVGEGVTVTSNIHDTFVVFSWRGYDVDAVDFHVELMLGKEGAYVRVVVAF